MAIVIVIVNDDDEYDNLTGYMSINKQYLNVLSFVSQTLCTRKSGRMDQELVLCQWPNFFSFILF